MFSTAIVTVSDRVSRGESIDKSGASLAAFISSKPEYVIVTRIIVPDEKEEIVRTLKELSARKVSLILTTGGTGFGTRDVTPEAVRDVIQREASGLTIAMMTKSLQITPLAALSRPVCGVILNSLIVTLPGSSKGSLENLEAIVDILPHALELIKGEVGAGESFHKQLHGGHQAKLPESDVSKSKKRDYNHTCVHHTDGQHSKRDGILSNDPAQAVTKRARISPYPMISIDEAMKIVLDHSFTLEEVEKSILDSNLIGHTISKDILSQVAVPSYRASIVDGYAVNHNYSPGVYPVQSSSVAGSSTVKQTLEDGYIMRVTTGAPVPDGASAVVMVEDTCLIEASPDGKTELKIEVKIASTEGQNIRPVGSDISIGDIVLKRGQAITPIGGEIGILASIGVVKIPVIQKPVIGILSTGNEVYDVTVNEHIPFGAIRDSNRPALKHAIESYGFKVIDFGIAGDQVDELKSTLTARLDSVDVLITTGGVSMGELDLLKPVLERELGAKVHFGRVALKPGKPTTFATLEFNGKKKLIFSLPGNPVSALVTFQIFVLPSIRKMSGKIDATSKSIKVKVDHDIILDPRPEFYRAILSKQDGNFFVAVGTGSQMSSRLASMSNIDVLLKLPARSESLQVVKKGSLVEAILL